MPGGLPNPGMDFTPFDTLPAAELDKIVENIEALSDGSGLEDAAVTPEKLVAGTGTSWDYQSYVPTVTLTGGASANGNAVITGAYRQIGKQVDFWIKYVIGNTTTFSGLTSLTYTLPVAMSAAFLAGNASFGEAAADISSAHYLLSNQTSSSTVVLLVAYNVASTYAVAANITATAPGTWGTGSIWHANGSYEAA